MRYLCQAKRVKVSYLTGIRLRVFGLCRTRYASRSSDLIYQSRPRFVAFNRPSSTARRMVLSLLRFSTIAASCVVSVLRLVNVPPLVALRLHHSLPCTVPI